MKFRENRSKGSGDMERTQNWKVIWPLSRTLTLSTHSQAMGSAHGLTERNIWVKLSENRSKGSGDMEGTRNPKVNPMTLKCDHDLKSGWLSYGALHTISPRCSFDQSTNISVSISLYPDQA